MNMILALLVMFSAELIHAEASSSDLSVEFLRAEDQRRVDGALLSYLRHPELEIRRRAALALGRIGTRAAIHALVQALPLEIDDQVRRRMAFALGLTGSTRGLRCLVDCLQRDQDAGVRERAAEALGRIGGPGVRDALVAALESLSHSPDASTDRLGRALIVALYRLDDRRALSALQNALEVPGSTRSHAVWALSRWAEPSSREAFPPLFGDPDPWVRKWSMRAAGGLASKDPLAKKDRRFVRAVLGGSRDEDGQVRIQAVRAMNHIHDGTIVDRVLEIALVEGAPLEREEAIQVLGTVKDDPRVVNALRVLSRRQDGFGGQARVSLSHLDPDPDRALTARRYLRQDDRLDRLDWVRSLEFVPGPVIDRALVELATGEPPWLVPDPVSSHAAVEILSRRTGVVDQAFWRARLGGDDPLDRSVAGDVLLEREGVASLDDLLAAARAGIGRFEEVDFRISLVAALAKREEPEARKALESFLDDPSRLVRRDTAKALRMTTLEETPLDLDRPDGYYRRVIDDVMASTGATIVTNKGSIEIRFFGSLAPLTVTNFINLARSGFYDGLPITRVVADFVVQMGDARGDLNGSPGYTIRCENSELEYRRGRVGMALSGKDTGGCQFFMTHSAQPHLDGSYTIFAEVTAGLEVVDQIVRCDRIQRILVHP